MSRKYWIKKASSEYKNVKLMSELYKRPIPDKGNNIPSFNVLEPGYVQQMDLLFLPTDSVTGDKYCLVVVDDHSKICDAEPLRKKEASAVLVALKKIYARGILKIPKSQIEVDSGSEFKGVVKQFFKSHGVRVKVGVPDRHSQQAIVERKNMTIGTKLYKLQVDREISTNESNTDWVEDLPKIVKEINEKVLKKEPKKIKPQDPPRAEGKSNILLEIGDKVRVLLNRPEDYITGEKLHGKFRNADYRWSPEVYEITKVFITPGQVPLYQVANDLSCAYTKNQLQVIEAKKDRKEEPKKEINIESVEEPKKEIEAKPKDKFIEKRISILWNDPKEWFDGTVVEKVKGGFYKVKYDDGDEKNHKFLSQSEGKTWKFL